jgi:hypothetical protein
MLEWLKTILGDAYTDEIDAAVSQEIGKGFVARKDFNDANDSKKTLETTLTNLAKSLSVEPDALTGKVTELLTTAATASETHAAELAKVKLNAAIETRLIKEGAVNMKAVRALLDNDKISLDGDTVKGLDEQITAIRTSDKWAFASLTPVTPPPRSGDRHGGAGGDAADVKAARAEEITNTLYGKTE